MDGKDVKRGINGQKKEKKNQTNTVGELEGRRQRKKGEIADHSLVLNG